MSSRFTYKRFVVDVIKQLNKLGLPNYKKLETYEYTDVWHAIQLTDYYKDTDGNGSYIIKCLDNLNEKIWNSEITVEETKTDLVSMWNNVIANQYIRKYCTHLDDDVYYMNPIEFRKLFPVTQRYIFKMVHEKKINCSNYEELELSHTDHNFIFINRLLQSVLENDVKEDDKTEFTFYAHGILTGLKLAGKIRSVEDDLYLDSLRTEHIEVDYSTEDI